MIRFIILIMFLLIATGSLAITGQDMVCYDLKFLSTECREAEVPGMEYFDKEVAIAEAQQDIYEGDKTSTNITVVVPQPKQPKEDVKVTTSFEEE